MQFSVVFQGFILEIENYAMDKGMMGMINQSGCQPTRHEHTNDLVSEPCGFLDWSVSCNSDVKTAFCKILAFASMMSVVQYINKKTKI